MYCMHTHVFTCNLKSDSSKWFPLQRAKWWACDTVASTYSAIYNAFISSLVTRAVKDNHNLECSHVDSLVWICTVHTQAQMHAHTLSFSLSFLGDSIHCVIFLITFFSGTILVKSPSGKTILSILIQWIALWACGPAIAAICQTINYMMFKMLKD